MSKRVSKKQANKEASECLIWVRVEDKKLGCVYCVKVDGAPVSFIPATWFGFDALGKGKLIKEYERHVFPIEVAYEKHNG